MIWPDLCLAAIEIVLFLEMGMSTRWYVIRCKSEILLYEQYSRIFFWKNKELNLNRGLVVDPADEKGMLEATKAYQSKSNLL